MATVAERSPLRLAGWGAAALAVALVHNRLWATPNLAFFVAISKRLGTNPFGNGFDGDYLLTNVSGPFLARALGQTDPHAYARLHLVVLLVGLVAVVAAAYRRFGYEIARLLCGLLAAAPALTITMEWLGQPDAFTLPLALGVVVARRRWTVLALAVALGATHAEQGIIVALVAAVVRHVVDETPVQLELAPLVGGVVGGRVLVEAYLRFADIVVTRPRTSYLDLGVSGFLEHHLKSHGVLVYALWGPLWIGIAVVAVRFVRSGASWPDSLRRRWMLLGLASVVAVIPMLATLDETRVYSLTTAPLLVGAAVLSRRTLDLVPTARLTEAPWSTRRLAVGVLAVALAVSPGLFTAGETYVAYDLPSRDFVRFLATGDHPGDLTTWLLAPFGFEVPTPHE